MRLAEGGGFALPSRASLEKMLPPGMIDKFWKNPDEADWKKLEWTDAWHHRATCPNLEPGQYPWKRTDLVQKMSFAIWGDVPRHDIDTFIEQSQAAQAEAIKFQIEHGIVGNGIVEKVTRDALIAECKNH